MDSLPMIYEGKLYGKIGSRYIPLKMTSDDVNELKQRHSEICGRLQECVQKHQIGLGGEKIDQLVCDHIEAQASQIEAMRVAIKEAHDALEMIAVGDSSFQQRNEASAAIAKLKPFTNEHDTHETQDQPHGSD